MRIQNHGVHLKIREENYCPIGGDKFLNDQVCLNINPGEYPRCIGDKIILCYILMTYQRFHHEVSGRLREQFVSPNAGFLPFPDTHGIH